MNEHKRSNLIEDYVSREIKDAHIMTLKLSKTYDDFDSHVRVWDLQLKDNTSWWVVEGDNVPMNLYPQKGFDFSNDEAYSFHMGLMLRLQQHQTKK